MTLPDGMVSHLLREPPAPAVLQEERQEAVSARADVKREIRRARAAASAAAPTELELSPHEQLLARMEEAWKSSPKGHGVAARRQGSFSESQAAALQIQVQRPQHQGR